MSDEPSSFREPFDTIWPDQAPAATGTPRTDALWSQTIRLCTGAEGAQPAWHSVAERMLEHGQSLETYLAAANAQLQQVTKERDDYRTRNDGLSQDLGNQSLKAMAEIGKLRARIELLEANNKELLASYDMIQEVRGKVERQRNEAETHIAELEQDYERLAAGNSSMEKEIPALRHRIAELEKEREAFIAARGGLLNDLHDAESERDRYRALAIPRDVLEKVTTLIAEHIEYGSRKTLSPALTMLAPYLTAARAQEPTT